MGSSPIRYVLGRADLEEILAMLPLCVELSKQGEPKRVLPEVVAGSLGAVYGCTAYRCGRCNGWHLSTKSKQHPAPLAVKDNRGMPRRPQRPGAWEALMDDARLRAKHYGTRQHVYGERVPSGRRWIYRPHHSIFRKDLRPEEP